MKTRVKIEASVYYLRELENYLGDAVGTLSVFLYHSKVTDRNMVILASLLTNLMHAVAIKLIKYKSCYTLNIDVAQACALHVFYMTYDNSMEPPAALRVIVAQIDQQTS
jgi:hypothetical protein